MPLNDLSHKNNLIFSHNFFFNDVFKTKATSVNRNLMCFHAFHRFILFLCVVEVFGFVFNGF